LPTVVALALPGRAGSQLQAYPADAARSYARRAVPNLWHRAAVRR